MSSMAPTTVKNGVVVGIEYAVRLSDGTMVDQAGAGDPLEYLHGADNLIPGLEKALTGMAIGEKKHVVIPPGEAYGEYNEDDIEEVERSLFPPNLDLEVGAVLSLRDGAGNVFEAQVIELHDDSVTLDFNHPLAGEELHFDVTVVSLRDATPEELAHGHAHSTGGHLH